MVHSPGRTMLAVRNEIISFVYKLSKQNNTNQMTTQKREPEQKQQHHEGKRCKYRHPFRSGF